MKALVLLVSVFAIACCQAEDDVQLRFEKADIKEVISLYEKLTKCHIVAGNLVIGSLSASTVAAVPPSKAIELIETALFANGFAIVQTKPDTIRILGIGENAASGPLPTLTKPEEIPVNERVVRY